LSIQALGAFSGESCRRLDPARTPVRRNKCNHTIRKGMKRIGDRFRLNGMRSAASTKKQQDGCPAVQQKSFAILRRKFSVGAAAFERAVGSSSHRPGPLRPVRKFQKTRHRKQTVTS
jgi:hypothetical protein